MGKMITENREAGAEITFGIHVANVFVVTLNLDVFAVLDAFDT